LNSYGTLEAIYDHLDELATGVRNKLKAHRQQAFLSQRLARIVTDLGVSLDLDQARAEQFNPQEVQELFRELEFRSLVKRLHKLIKREESGGEMSTQQMSLFGEGISLAGSTVGTIQAEVVDTSEKLERLVQRLREAKTISFDTETTSTNQMLADLVGISLAVDPERGYYIPVGHRAALGAQLPLPMVMEALRGPMTDPQVAKIGHNVKYDYVLLARHGLQVSPLAFDSMIAEWLHNPDSRNLGLKKLAWVRLNYQMRDIEQLIGKGRTQRSMAEVPIDQAAAYAAADAAVVLRLQPELLADLEKCRAVDLFNQLEMPLVPILAQMEMDGIALDVDYLSQMAEMLTERMNDIASRVFQAVGETFNLNSTQQLSKVLFERLKLTPPGRTRRTASGYYSTSASVLEAMRGQHPVVDWVLEYRELSKLKSTYVDALPLQVNPQTERLHTSYNQTGTVTGRIASSNPNLQNIPIRTEVGRLVRNAFVAAEGHLLLSVDYSQVELRIVAHISGDEAMIQAFRAGQDIHATTAAAIYDVPIDQVTKAQRRHAKAINFGLIYGMSAFGLTRTTELTLAEAEDFVRAYFAKFPGVKRYLDGVRRRAAQKGYVETLMGRRRYFPGLQTPSSQQARLREEREAINAPIQGTAADIIKLAMLRVPKALAEASLSARMLLQVHDELVLECPREELQATASVVQEVMEAAYPLDVPLSTDARYGSNWGEMRPLA
jgi:DNA polymerase-1